MGKLHDEYEILSELGSGGMATVYKAIQKSLDRPVAIKELKKSYRSDSQIVQRFEREAKISASFQHENIVHIYDYWKSPDYCIVMEYVDGVDLADIIEKTGPFSRGCRRHDRPPGMQRPRVCTHARAYPPRHKTEQHHDKEERRSEAHGLRHCSHKSTSDPYPAGYIFGYPSVYVA